MAKYRVKQTFGIAFEGAQVTVEAGSEVDTGTKNGAKLVKQLGSAGVDEHLEEYAPAGLFARADVETATAAPGEKRGAPTRTAKK